MWISYYIFLSLFVHHFINGQVKTNKRQKRYLLFTSSTQFGVFATVSVPLNSESTVSVAWFFEANYYNVANATYFEPLLGDIITSARSREERSNIEEPKDIVTRNSLYTFIESMLQKHGYAGRSCLLRSICESSASHFLHNGLLGDLLHLILTPSTSMSEEDVEDCFYEAEYYGLEKQCENYVTDCPYSPLEDISISVEELM